MTRLRLLALITPIALTAACADRRTTARADSLQAVTTEQLALMSQLSAQKDSLTGVVLDADQFISHIDSQIKTVKGLPAAKRKAPLESPIEEQLQARKEMLARVEALVARTKTTANQLAASRRREQALKGDNTKLQGQVDADQQMIAELGATIERQTTTIAELQGRVDSLVAGNRELGEAVRTIDVAHHKAYYIVGTERELLAKGVITREGGANLLVRRVGRALLPARAVNPQLFTAIDQREVRDIPLPDSTKRYRIVSRQSLDNANVAERDGATFRGALQIADPEKFWAPSRYLIVVQP